MSIDFNAPKQKSQVLANDVYPNLLATVLAAAAVFLPAHSGRATESAPPAKIQVQVDAIPRPTVLGLQLSPNVRQLYDSAPQVKYVAPLGQPLVRASGLPIIAAPAFFQQLSASAPPPKAEVYSNPAIYRPSQLPINAAPAVLQLNQSAPPLKYQPQIDISPYVVVSIPQQIIPRISFINTPQGSKQNLDRQHVNLLPLTSGIVPPQIQPSLTHAPIAKYQVFADTIRRPFVLPINPAPAVRQQSDSAPQPKKDIRFDLPADYRPFQGLSLPPVTLAAGASAPAPKVEVVAYNAPAPYALGIPVNTTVSPRNSFSAAPQRPWQNSVDQVVNTALLSTQTIPFTIGQLTQSAPVTRFEIHSDVYPNIITLPAGVPLPVVIGQQTDSAPQPKFPVYADVVLNPALGINLPPGVLQWWGSAPPPKYQTQPDVLPNVSPLVVSLPPVVGRLSDAAPPPKRPVTYEHPQRFVGLGINPAPAVARWSDSSPIVKSAVFAQNFGSPTVLGEPAAIPPSIAFLRWDWPATPPKYQVYSDPTVTRPAVLPLNPTPNVGQLSTSAPALKYQVIAEQYINPSFKPTVVIYPIEPQWIINLPPRNWTVTLSVSWVIALPNRTWIVTL